MENGDMQSVQGVLISIFSSWLASRINRGASFQMLFDHGGGYAYIGGKFEQVKQHRNEE